VSTRSVDRGVHPDEIGVVTLENDRSAVARDKDRASLCSFTLTDGRHCRTPRRDGHPHLCAFHARKEAQASPATKPG